MGRDRHSHRVAGLLGLAVAALACGGSEAPRPNIVLFLADDLGWSDTSVYGSTFYETPNIERLARGGMTFSDAYAHPVCSPSRASLLTGLYPARLRFTKPSGHLPREVLEPTLPPRAPPSWRAVTPETRTRLPNDYVTLAEALKGAGYATGFFGKWHLGRTPYVPGAQGFDVVVGGTRHHSPPGGYFSPWTTDALPSSGEGEHISDVLAREAARFVAENEARPFFLAFWDYSVHAPFQAKRELIEAFRGKVDPGSPQQSPVMAAMIATLDDTVGTLLGALEEHGLAENTIFLFLSDNGGSAYNSVGGVPVTSNAPLRAGKTTTYEGGTRVPMIVSWPAAIRAGSASKTPVASIDVYPSLLDLLGLDAPRGVSFDGVSIAPVLRETGPLAERDLFFHFPHYTQTSDNAPSTAVRSGRWKGIRLYAEGRHQRNRFELYDLEADIGERNDLSAERPDVVRDLEARIDAHLAETDALVPIANPAYRPTTAPAPRAR